MLWRDHVLALWLSHLLGMPQQLGAHSERCAEAQRPSFRLRIWLPRRREQLPSHGDASNIVHVRWYACRCFVRALHRSLTSAVDSERGPFERWWIGAGSGIVTKAGRDWRQLWESIGRRFGSYEASRWNARIDEEAVDKRSELNVRVWRRWGK